MLKNLQYGLGFLIGCFATLTLSIPDGSGVTASTTSLSFDQCYDPKANGGAGAGLTKTVTYTFTQAAQAPIKIDVSVADTQGKYSGNASAKFRVSEPTTVAVNRAPGILSQALDASGLEGGTDAELGLGGEGALDAGEAAIDADGFHEVAFFLGDLGHEKKGVADERAVGEAALEFDALGGGAVEVVHRVVDLPHLDVGLFQQTLVERAVTARDLLGLGERLLVTIHGLLGEPEVLVNVADVLERLKNLLKL